MRAPTFTCGLLLLAVGFTPLAPAQVIQILGPNPVIAGTPVSCMGAISYVAHIPDIAMAQPGALLFRPDYFSLPPYVQLFIYGHECAHQIYGGNEQAADCWSVRLGRNQGFFTPAALQQICAFTFPSPGDWSHLPGPLRCQQMQACYFTP
ncbi:hypothetical protein LOY54_16765 [Pseudomonas sp. B21-032]|uniref:hypothetical protein n=1 Tax=Pseudomonas TaxID=286 RepID=UPI002160EB2E|nr:hypothetical protein [Pseudomonas sp. B21-032]UVL59697.1 hypothetical protein LOY54_16765 [Pseudomonas sp. B21-032]